MHRWAWALLLTGCVEDARNPTLDDDPGSDSTFHIEADGGPEADASLDARVIPDPRGAPDGGDAFVVRRGDPCSEVGAAVGHCASDPACPALQTAHDSGIANDLAADACADGLIDSNRIFAAETCDEMIAVARAGSPRVDAACAGEALPDAAPQRTADAARDPLERDCQQACWVVDGCVQHDACGGTAELREEIERACRRDCGNRVFHPADVLAADSACADVIEALRAAESAVAEICPEA